MKQKIKQFIRTFLPIVLMLFVCGSYGTGFMGLFVFMFWLPYTLIQAWVTAKNKQWHLFRRRLLAWCGLWIGLYAIHQYHAYTARQQAQQVIQQVEQYQAKHGKLPTQDEIPIAKFSYTRPFYVQTKSGEAYLIYRDNVMLFDEHVYDFQTKTWNYQLD